MSNSHLLVNYSNAPFNLANQETSSRGVSIFSFKPRNVRNGSLISKLRQPEGSFPVQCCCSSAGLDVEKNAIEGSSSKYLVCDSGWGVRRLVENNGDEMREAVQLQAEAFHVPMAILDDWFFQFFKAEVLSGLVYKLRNSPPNRYACLVAESTDPIKNHQELVGIVDVTVQRDQSVVPHLSGDSAEYLYVSGIAVSTRFRRKRVATALLKACDSLSVVWDYEYLVLRAYADDWGARNLYAKAGYEVVSTDPPWMGWIGAKRRVLMIKKKQLD